MEGARNPSRHEASGVGLAVTLDDALFGGVRSVFVPLITEGIFSCLLDMGTSAGVDCVVECSWACGL